MGDRAAPPPSPADAAHPVPDRLAGDTTDGLADEMRPDADPPDRADRANGADVADRAGPASTSAVRVQTPTPRPGPAHPPTARPRSWIAQAHNLRERDQILLTLLREHPTLTTPQIHTLLFPSLLSAQRRLKGLRQQGWVSNFQAWRAGRRLTSHWVLDVWGNRWAAAHVGERPISARQLADRNEAAAGGAQLAHADGVHEFFVSLVAAARVLNAAQDIRTGARESSHLQDGSDGSASSEGDIVGHTAALPAATDGTTQGAALPGAECFRLARWWSAAHTANAVQMRVHPDGHGVWEYSSGPLVPPHQVGFYLEYDRGTETLHRLAAKVTTYQQARAEGMGPEWILLIVVPGPKRERNLHRALADVPVAAVSSIPAYDQAGPQVSVLTTNLATLRRHPLGPAGGVWWLVHPGAITLTGPGPRAGEPEPWRIALHQMPATRFGATPLDPGPPHPEDDPLRALASLAVPPEGSELE